MIDWCLAPTLAVCQLHRGFVDNNQCEQIQTKIITDQRRPCHTSEGELWLYGNIVKVKKE